MLLTLLESLQENASLHVSLIILSTQHSPRAIPLKLLNMNLVVGAHTSSPTNTPAEGLCVMVQLMSEPRELSWSVGSGTALPENK